MPATSVVVLDDLRMMREATVADDTVVRRRRKLRGGCSAETRNPKACISDYARVGVASHNTGVVGSLLSEICSNLPAKSFERLGSTPKSRRQTDL